VLGSGDPLESERLRQVVEDQHEDLALLARRLREAHAELQQLHRLRDQFLGVAVQHLRQPAGMAMAYGELLLDEVGLSLGDEHRRFLEGLCMAMASTRRLSDSFLGIALAETGHLEVRREHLDMVSLVREVVALVMPMARRKGMTLAATCQSDTLPLDADRALLAPVLTNLIANAVDRGPHGSRVSVDLRSEPTRLYVDVHDEGPGIPSEALRNLFSLFPRGDHPQAAGHHGTGPALAVARLVTESHGGSLVVHTAPGEGSTFTMVLPTR